MPRKNLLAYDNTLNLSSIASFYSFYGIGKVKAVRISSFLLQHPLQRELSKDLKDIARSEIGSNIFFKMPLDLEIRVNTSLHLQHRISTFCYQAHRLFQGLPTKGQRTKCNRQTSRRDKCNPYKKLRVNEGFYPDFEDAYKKEEFLANSRFEELKALNEAIEQREKKPKKE